MEDEGVDVDSEGDSNVFLKQTQIQRLIHHDKLQNGPDIFKASPQLDQDIISISEELETQEVPMGAFQSWLMNEAQRTARTSQIRAKERRINTMLT